MVFVRQLLWNSISVKQIFSAHMNTLQNCSTELFQAQSLIASELQHSNILHHERGQYKIKSLPQYFKRKRTSSIACILQIGNNKKIQVSYFTAWWKKIISASRSFSRFCFRPHYLNCFYDCICLIVALCHAERKISEVSTSKPEIQHLRAVHFYPRDSFHHLIPWGLPAA